MGLTRSIVSWVLTLGFVMGAQAQDRMQIQYAEAVDMVATPGASDFDAFGRRFAVELESNDRLFKALPGARKAQLKDTLPVRGVIAGVPGSWVRLTRVGGSLEGAIWDGQELYAVTSASRIARYLISPLEVPSSQTVIYRLSDTLDALPSNYCGLQRVASGLKSTPTATATALKQYQSMVDELRMAAAVTPTDQLSLSLIADTAFQSSKGASTTEEMVSRLNIVDGIFAAQVGVLLVPSELRLLPAGNPLTSSDSSTLLQQLGDFRNSTPAVRSAGLAHLISGTHLEDNILGIAYLDSLCEQHDGVSLSTSDDVPIANAVVMAHEIGHNFGAQHDGETGSVCASTEPNFVMGAIFTGSIFFSDCSKATMAPKIAQARGACIGSPDYADVGLSVPASTTSDVNVTFSVPFTVSSQGNRPATNVTLDVMLGSSLSFQSAVVVNGSCAVVNANLHCTLGDIPAGVDRVVDVRLNGSQVSQYNLVASVSADNDYLVDDNEKQYQLNLQSAADLAVAATVSPGTVFIGDPFQVTVDVSALRSQTVHGATLGVNLFGMPVDAIAGGVHTCTVSNNTVALCQLADLAPGASSRIIVTGHGNSPRNETIQVGGQVAGDGNEGNNYVNLNVNVRSDREVLTTVSAPELNAVLGQSYDITFTLTAAGRNALADVQFRMDKPAFDYFTVVSILPSAGICDLPNNTIMRCNFGTLVPGDVRTVVVRVLADKEGTTNLNGRSEFFYNGALAFSPANVTLRSAVAVDLYAQGFAPPTITEGGSDVGQIMVWPAGSLIPQNVVATLDVPAPLRLTAVGGYENSGLSCAVQTAQRIRCTGSYTTPGNIFLSYRYTGDTAGDYPMSFHITADGDANDANDDVAFTIRVLPYLDVGIATAATRIDLYVGEITTLETTVTAGTRAVPGVRVVAGSNLPYYEVESMSAPGFVCQLEANGASCSLGDLPAGAIVPVTVRYRTLRDNLQSSLAVGVLATRDSNPANNGVHLAYDIMTRSDIQLQVARTSVSATSGARFQFPQISVRSATALARNVVVTIPIPNFATVESISGNAFCTGTTTLRCEMAGVDVGTTSSLDISLLAAARGSFTSNVTMTARNDSTAGNNAISVAVEVTAAPGSSSGGGSSGGGGGGGGRIEWALLATLGVMAARRARFKWIRAI